MSERQSRLEELNSTAEANRMAAGPSPDIEKMCSWITDAENYADEQFPQVSPTCEDLLTELHRDLANVFSAMRERLT